MAGELTATAAAAEVLRDLTAAHGPLAIFQSGGCCDGSSPICLRAGELAPARSDLLLGSVAGVPFYVDSDMYERWGRPGFELDVAPGDTGSFSLEGAAGVHFVTRSPATTQ
jgi:uncharacterized protein